MWQEYDACLSRIRSYLASGSSVVRTREVLSECERLLLEAKACATAMQGLAEVQGDSFRVQESQQRIDRDVNPLQKEIQRALQELERNNLFSSSQQQHGQYYPPNGNNSDMTSLIQSSDDLLRESQAILAETEQIGISTIQQMGYQREQILGANQNASTVLEVAGAAGNILRSMSRRALNNKLSLYVIIGILICANLYVLRLMYKKNHHHQSDTPNPNSFE
jgi:vesicle transport through interaction with t-SNAREs 1